MRRLIALALVLGGCPSEPAHTPPPEPPPAPPVEEPAPEPVAEAPAEMDQVTITTTKKETVEDQHTATVSGMMFSLGTADDLNTLTGTVTVDLATWASSVELRDERVKTLFLKTDEFPQGTFTIESASGFSPIAAGSEGTGALTGTLAFGGVTLPLTVKVKAEHRDLSTWRLATAEPVSFSAADVGLSDRVKAVADACGVPVSEAVRLDVGFTAQILPR